MKQDQNNTALSAMSDADLLQELKKRKSLSVVYAVIIALMMAFAAFNGMHKGSMIFTVMPIVFLPIFVTIQKAYSAAKAEAKSRNLQ